jgi:hypothetical protein
VIRGYTSVERVEHHTGRTFDAAQRAECSLLLPVAESWIDGYTRRTWGTQTPIAGEVHGLEAPTWPRGAGAVDVVYDLTWYPPLTVRLRVRPVAAVTAVAVRTTAAGSAPQALTAGTQYELLDAEQGLLSVANGYGGWLALVDYTPAVPVDPRVGAEHGHGRRAGDPRRGDRPPRRSPPGGVRVSDRWSVPPRRRR